MEIKNLSVYCTICAGVLSHFLLLVCLAKDPLKCFRNSASYLVGNLALADFIVCSLGMMRDMIFVNNLEVTTFLEYAATTATLISVFSLFSVALDRYVLTVHPFTHRSLLNGRKIAVWIVSIWLLSSYYLIKGSIFGLHKVDGIIYLMIYIIVPSLSRLIYLVTFFALRKQGRDISQHGQFRNRTLQQEFLKTIIVVAFIQFFTLVPTTIAALISVVTDSPSGRLDGDSTIVRVISYQVYFLNFAINPFLYIWRLKNYRRTFCLVVCRKTG
jgi:hypothetical protein